MRALRGAVNSGRVSHAYLFSGPRGTGKTTTARILAKALNCEQPRDGDACDRCASCLAITKGTSLDVIELDAASNNGVDDIREITAGAWHGTPGSWKIYIFDEVHQLSKAASAALLKTLEEPPQHVIFVLATTDPHKVLPTIRSRTQHLEFRLFGGETLGTLLRDVRSAAQLNADDATIEAAVRMGRGSARDALSALDQLIATGSVADARPEFDGLFHALANADAVEALSALAVLTHEGWDPEQLAENFAGEVRQAFLLQVAPKIADPVDSDRERLTTWGTQLGLARTVRILETMGRAIRDMKGAPEKIVMLEIAMVRLVRPELESTYEALDERLSRLEHASNTAPVLDASPAPASRPIGGAKDAPKGTKIRRDDAPDEGGPLGVQAVGARGASLEETIKVVTPTSSGGLDVDDVRARFVERVIPRTSRSAQLLLKSAQIRSLNGTQLTIALATEEMRQNTELISQGLRGALDHEFKVPIQITWIVDPTITSQLGTAVVRRKTTEPTEEVADDGIEVDESSIVVDSVAEHLIAQAFPGSEEIS